MKLLGSSASLSSQISSVEETCLLGDSSPHAAEKAHGTLDVLRAIGTNASVVNPGL